MLGAADAWDWVQAECGARQALQRAILLERICELDDARHVLAVVGEVVAAQAVSTSAGRQQHYWLPTAVCGY